jgi:Protein of unknown function (DUF3551)
MRLGTKVIAALVALMAVPAQTSTNALPYDPYPWCANYDGGKGFGGQNCGFSTWGQCMATVSGIGGFCVPNQFYNPGQASAGRVRKKRQY